MANGAPGPRGPQLNVQPVEDTSEEGQIKAEIAAGLRCFGCKQRIVNGYEFKILRKMIDPIGGRRASRTDTAFACITPDCDYVFKCAEEATAARKIRNEWMFLDDERIAALLKQASDV